MIKLVYVPSLRICLTLDISAGRGLASFICVFCAFHVPMMRSAIMNAGAVSATRIVPSRYDMWREARSAGDSLGATSPDVLLVAAAAALVGLADEARALASAASRS